MSRPLKSLVIGTSLSPHSDGIVRTGAALARATGAVPWLLHAYTPLLGAAGSGVEALWMEDQVSSLKELLGEQAARTGLSQVPGFSPDRTLLMLGAPHREIVDLARRIEAGLIVLGAVESSYALLGSTADRVIRKAPCPVFAVRPEAPFPPRRVEIPVDLSPFSAYAFRTGLGVLSRIGVPLTDAEALFVLNPYEVAGSLTFKPDQIERFAGEELRRFVAANSSGPSRPKLAQVRTGAPRQEILAALAERNADLAVLGTHGRSGFERLLLGSVASGVLQRASCNLLVIPPATSPQEVAVTEGREALGADWSYVSDEDPVAAAKAAPSSVGSEYWYG